MKNKKRWISLGVLILGAAVAFHYLGGRNAPDTRPGAGQAMPVMAATAHSGDIDVVINALGTVTALNTATVKVRVDGLLTRIDFRDGQLVKNGQALAQIDPRPFQILLDQATGQLARDQALLANAKLDYARYSGLLAKDSIARQQVDAQASLVRQYEGTVAADRAQVDSAKLNLEFTLISAPISGRIGLRQVDTGNMVHSTDANGLAVITETQPIYVIFAIPADAVSAVLSKLGTGESLAVDALDRDGKTRLATGRLLMVDNQIDLTTGTVKLKAQFANSDNKLFPNQFVNARLRVETRHGAVLVPAAAVQRGTPGTFVYVIGKEQTVAVRPVTLGAGSADNVAIEKGLAPGEQVVVDGADKLREGATVDVSTLAGNSAAGVSGQHPGEHRGTHRHAQTGQEGSKAPAP